MLNGVWYEVVNIMEYDPIITILSLSEDIQTISSDQLPIYIILSDDEIIIPLPMVVVIVPHDVLSDEELKISYQMAVMMLEALIQ
jgi:hypothetical protein